MSINHPLYPIIATARIQRVLMNTLKRDLKQLQANDVTGVQALLLYQVGKTPTTIGALSQRQHHLGSNITHNVRRLIEAGYMDQTPSLHDKRSVSLSLTPKGLDIYTKLQKHLQHRLDPLQTDTLEKFSGTLKRVERELISQYFH